MPNKAKIIAIVGPTASGKTELSIRVAHALDGEIISCDSMQIYKKMDIGTAKPSKEEMMGIPHHIIDAAEPDSVFSCADYKALAEEAAADIISRNKTPIFCGGTGLYLDSVLKCGFSPNVPVGIREELSKRDADSLYEQLCSVDPISAQGIHKNNVKRVIRALEIYIGTGRTKTEWDELSKSEESDYDPLIFGLDFENRDVLYDRINRRVDIMLENGLVDEVKNIRSKLSQTSSQGIGYKEIIKYLDGELSFDDAVELLKKNTRNYAKRQLTYFRRNKNIIWSYPDKDGKDKIFENIVNIALKHLNN